MNSLRFKALCFFAFASFFLSGCGRMTAQFVPDEWVIPTRGNSYVTSSSVAEPSAEVSASAVSPTPLARVGRNGFILKNDMQSIVSTYIYISETATPELSLNAVGLAQFTVTCGQQKFAVEVNDKKIARIPVGQLKIDAPQYIRLDFQLKETGRPSYVVVRDVILSGLQMRPLFLHQKYDDYFGRRGPSVHLSYRTKPVGEADWAYVEVSVPDDGDVVGSYYCAAGFDGGYFGFQHNSATERKVLFSVWNAMDADNPRDVSASFRVKILSTGTGAVTGDFGNEGSGQQCFLSYDWKPGHTYGFLLHAVRAQDEGATEYSAYFRDVDAGTWHKMATMRRPHTDICIQGLYSFVENFLPDMGNVSRRALFNNVWLHSVDDGAWHEVRSARFTNDETGNRGIRVDFAGTVEGDKYCLKMGGYFGNGTLLDRALDLPAATDSEQQAMAAWLQQETEHINNIK